MKTTVLAATRQLLEALGHTEIPFGTLYSDKEPSEGYSAEEGRSVVELTERAEDIPKLFANFKCFIGSIRTARKKHVSAYIGAHKFGCPGGSYYCGFPSSPAQVDVISRYVSTGGPGLGTGERYFSSPQGMRRFMAAIEPPPATARYCVTQALDLFAEGEEPLLVSFFARPEVICGLSTLVAYATDEYDRVVAHFGPGCGIMAGWPLRMSAEGRECAVLGISDPSCRKFLKTDEQIFTIPFPLYARMLEAVPESFLRGHTWESVYKKVLHSRKAWGER